MQDDHQTVHPLADDLPCLLRERGLSTRALAARVGVSHVHLGRVLRGVKRPTGDLAARVAAALGLPEDYFPETREATVVDAVRCDSEFRDDLYVALRHRPRGGRRR